MKFTLSWLKKFLDTDATVEQITESLTMLGLEVEEVIDHADKLAGFEVAEIIDTKPHPDADKLRVCTVKTSSGIAEIVCGAPNARQGIKVVLAKIGTVIPNGNFTIKQSKIRGVESCGMLCSAEELNIKGDSSGIMELPQDAKVGDKITGYLGLDDKVIHIYVTPNRADALGVYGIARDLAAAGLGRLKELTMVDSEDIDEKFTSDIKIDVANPEGCPLFVMREIRGVKQADSPKWLKECLENIGIGSISPLVDVTNYICYSFGQPMHAYDADKINQGLEVRVLTKPETFLALNDKEYNLATGDLVIHDVGEIHCLAGIIGGKNSACSSRTNRIILEAASFDSKYISRTGRKLMVDTDSRHRFERYVDPEFTLKALNYATNLILSICGGEASEIKVAGAVKSLKRKIDFPISFFAHRAGFALDKATILNILQKLGFECHDNNQEITITVPSWRYDVTLKEDIVEEILRVHGYDKIPLSPLSGADIQRIIDREQKRLMDIKRLLSSNGYIEVISWSFMDSRKAAEFTDLKSEFMLANPVSQMLDYMRPSILPNLLKFASNNLSRSFKDFSLFELGPIFQDSDNTSPLKSVAGIRIGNNYPKNVHIPAKKYDVFDIKADLEQVLGFCGLELDKCQIKQGGANYYHPGRSGSVMLGKNLIAWFGQIHPRILKIFDIEPEVMAFELNIGNLPTPRAKLGRVPEYKISDYQMIIRDYAFIMDIHQQLGEVLACVRNTDKQLIRNVSLFDIYSGDKIEQGKKSVAISVVIQDDNKTLSEGDIERVHKLIISTLEKKFGAYLRES